MNISSTADFPASSSSASPVPSLLARERPSRKSPTARRRHVTARWSSLQSPLGEICVAVGDDGSVLATAFGNFAALRSRAPSLEFIEDAEATSEAKRDLDAYFADPKYDFSVKLAPQGTPFQQRVWSVLQGIPAGETRSYGQLAAQLGSSPRAVGGANASNPICLFIPCHRVIGADGSLTGFAFGEAIKRGLLAHERGASPPRTPSASPGP